MTSSYRLPVVQVGQVDLPVVVYEHTDVDAHVCGGLHVAQGSILGVGVHQPNADGNVVGVVWRRRRGRVIVKGWSLDN